MDHLDIVAAASIITALVGLLTYRLGLGAVHHIKRAELFAAEDTIRTLRESIQSLQTSLCIERDDAHQANTQLALLMKKQEHHQAQLEAIMQDADHRIAVYASRALTEDDAAHLHAMERKLSLAAKFFAGLDSQEHAQAARQLGQRALLIATKYQPAAASTWERVDEAMPVAHCA